MNTLRCCWCWLVVVCLLATLVSARPQELEDEEGTEASDRHGSTDDFGRVQIKVYRGPTKNDGYAPWGYWVKQPADE